MQQAEESFRRYAGDRLVALSRVAYLLTGDVHQAEDLVQATLEQVAARWERIVRGGDPDPYVRRVLYSQHVSAWRRHRGRVVPVAEPPEAPGSAAADHSGRVVLSLAVREALGRLSSRQRAVLVLRYFEDQTEARTAEILGLSVGTVKGYAREALARLREVAPELAAAGEGS
ncbi:SigE family RNA polymerase sigma factor [Dactylosporangium vinaceum]|uniref:SigE family RNA polymerase sigma factor n=1 Tax=Dactylosporangium vinaceum TaxID=53362 RepID=A0ABV5MJM0_9ACTN|nr:SigE family RNA polymerase sigma factor [Dactylosporangium vinaceum]UAB92638.1 SigE family RNA polymerase sigma factor [Dactylosporangium vinaceum]